MEKDTFGKFKKSEEVSQHAVHALVSSRNDINAVWIDLACRFDLYHLMRMDALMICMM